MHILVTDDEDSVKVFLWDLLRSQGHIVDCLSNGSDLYKVLSGHKPHYDLAICDIHMPEMNGDEAVQLSEIFGNEVPVIFISGLPKNRDQEFKHFLLKPFTSNDLLSLIQDIFSQK